MEGESFRAVTGGGTGKALGRWKILLNYKFPRIGLSLIYCGRTELGGLVLSKSFDRCSHSSITANVLRFIREVLTSEELWEVPVGGSLQDLSWILLCFCCREL